MQTILALLEIIKTMAAISASDKLEERSRIKAASIMHTCLQMVQNDTDELSLAQNNVQLTK